MDRTMRMRLKWARRYLTLQDAGLVCRRCGISRPTLRKWIRRYKDEGIEGLKNRSRRPRESPNQKITALEEGWVLDLRKSHNLGARRIQSELIRRHQFHISLATIHKVLKRNRVEPLRRLKRIRLIHRYSRPIPGDRVQMDTMKIAPRMYQYTAVDDCTSYRGLGLFPNRNTDSTLQFWEQVVEEMPFPVQRIQTDRGREFFAHKVQAWMMESRIRFRPIRPALPHLNGKVERSQTTDLAEFNAMENILSPDLESRLGEWQHFYNWYRPHSSLNGRSPMDRFFKLIHDSPYSYDIWEIYNPEKEWFGEANYRLDLELQRVKRSL